MLSLVLASWQFLCRLRKKDKKTSLSCGQKFRSLRSTAATVEPASWIKVVAGSPLELNRQDQEEEETKVLT